MKTCERCGNDIAPVPARCPFCGSLQQQKRPGAGSRSLVRDINIEAGLPVVEEGLARLERELLLARHAGVKIVRVIHGWGSSGTGGRLRDACRARLRQKKALKQIRGFLPGEEYSRHKIDGKVLISRYPYLSRDERTDSGNPGITLVEL